jgi:putative SOS response-associated peptidase YedK
MCGRCYSLFDKQQIAEHLGIIAPNYNMAPGDLQPVIRRHRATLESAGWS